MAKWARTLCLLAAVVSISCSAATQNFTKFWSGVDLSNLIGNSKHWHYDLFFQARLANNRNKLEQTLIRPSIYYETGNLSFWLGYDLIPTVPRNQLRALIEQRVWQQVEYQVDLSKHLVFDTRTRLETRWRQNSSSTAMRLRQRFELSLINTNKLGIDFDIFDELFFGIKRPSWVSNETIDQNRAFIGVVVPFSKVIAVDCGYLNIYRPRSPVSRFDHIIVVAIAIGLDERSQVPIRAI